MSGLDKHIERVLETTESPQAAALCRLAASWSRSITKHGLHPGEQRVPERIEFTTLTRKQDEFGDLIRFAAPRLDHLFRLVGKPGCGVLLTDANGVVMDQRRNDGDADTFDEWGFCIGTDWSEAAEGTNGVGTCLVENRQVVIHRDQHFYARNTAISCIGAPIYGPDGELIGAVDVSSARDDQTTEMNQLIAALVAQAALAIELDGFRRAYGNRRIVMLGSEDADGNMLLAVDEDDLVVGATRKARRKFQLGVGQILEPCLASDLLSTEEGTPGFAKAERTAVLQTLAQTGHNVSEAARRLGIGRATLYRRMKRLNISARN